ncbi:MAG: hypothetical protein LW832_01385 [Parachlamydia sp.]|jgi:chemotaxis protein methyltransferase WspC|nr:hypothetical protein [Parachlamydia sp.]
MEEINYFKKIIYYLEERIGINSNLVSKNFWKSAINKRMMHNQIYDYKNYYLVLHESKTEYEQMIESIVTPETWFFRDKNSIDYCTEVIRQNESIYSKILSLPCSSGEEPYSIAISLLEGGISPHHFHIDAVDISLTAIEKAKEGSYGQNSFRNKFFDYKPVYFKKLLNEFKILDKVKQQVTFYKSNVLEQSPPFEEASYHFIFCRKLLIYLSKQAQEKLFILLKYLLKEEGILIVGPSESHLVLMAGFFPYVPTACAFKKAQPKKMINQVLHPISITSETKKNLLKEANQLASDGFLKEAEKTSWKVLQTFGPEYEAYFLLGLLKHAVGEEKEAENFFKKALYLLPNHYESLIYLALLYEKKGESEQAAVLHARAKKLQMGLAQDG